MIEKTILNFLNDSETLPTAYMEIPANPPKRFIIIEKTGGSESNHIKRSTFAIQSYAESLYQAAALNESIKACMLDDLITVDEVASVRLNSNYNYTDSETKRYRYQAVFDITHY